MLISHDAPANNAESPSEPLRVFAPAKVNLFLEILGKRADGFHEIATLMLAVDLGDELTFESAEAGVLSLTTDKPELDTGPGNLVCRAAELLRNHTGCQAGAKIHLEKRIPWAAGLGGGSSDAAATFTGLNRLWELNLPVDELAGLAAKLGSDIPFFLNGPAGWATGRGEVIEPAPVGGIFDLVLVKPEQGLGTADVYRRLRIPEHPVDGRAAREALAAGDAEELGRCLHNRLQEPAFELAPVVADWHRRLRGYGTAGTLMSGSGSCLFVLCRNAGEARQVADDLSNGLASQGDVNTRVFRVRSRS
ncbi:4-(cytidine 5'-diphospho)-2-C-methyl-D-erythritol kinase [Zavarzinella formosa]|uniref:4-(cytidine 5'-diphospho)-2-C-methyl-D-erythritol kinase n=1 Tax=Zavarzinella formosa TaxID=360055 RepID=UPI00037C06C4|nr:4-(cytidine 5'-diphospho)-2-C-methyl-D-erythritol kinase [Zavarzinella formosa]